MLGSLGVAAYGQLEAESSGQASELTFIFLLASLALLFESCLSAGAGVFMQWVFKDMDALWVRNAQFAVMSMLLYWAMHTLKDGDTCKSELDVRGATVAVLYAAMGISVALTILWLGAIEKTLASVSSVVLTMVGDHLLVSHSWPSLLEIILSASIINGIIHFSLVD
jgi:hypothetical protein